jgi:hypothetical protein
MKYPPSRKPRGFALIVTLTLMVLLTILGLGLLSLSAVSLRATTSQESLSIARANARLALMLAIGELQKAAGPDQRVTLTSGLRDGAEPANPNWTGAIDVSAVALGSDPKSAAISWLVSGDKPDPAAELNETNSSHLATTTDVAGVSKVLRVPQVNLSTGKFQGRYSWWIGDEGTKARVDLAAPKTEPSADRDRLARSQSPLEPGLENLGPDWKVFEQGGALDRARFISVPTTSLAVSNPQLASRYFNDITSGGFGLPTSVAAGGMKADLSLLFDRSQVGKAYAERYCGATSTSAVANGVTAIDFSIRNARKYFLSETISKNGALQTGPNWGNLWSYATLWQNVSGNQMPLIGPSPLVESDLRYKTWLPYTNYDQGSFRRDTQQTNSPVAPVLSMLQMGFRFTSEQAPPTNPPSSTVMYKAQVGIQPVLGIWNPYNVAIKAAPYRFEWALYPYFRFNYAKPTGTGKFTDGRLTRLWLRDEWTTGSNGVPTPENPAGGKYFSVESPSVDLQPGEFRLFSVTDKIKIKAGSTYTLKSGWSEMGAFIVDLKADDGSDRLVPKGYRAWFGGIVLQDTQSAETKSRYPSLDLKNTASTWFTLKSSNTILLRSTELWNGGDDPSVESSYAVPEPVVSGSSGGLDTTKTTYLIDDLEGDAVSAPIATWSFFTRTTNQVEGPDENQRLRGWIDSNPRALVTNPTWDGSKVSSTGERTGWHLTSHLMGGWNAPGKPKQVGDGRGGNRGLIAEGGSAIPEPQMNKAGGRYQGYGGASNTTSLGKNNVIVYDVPRSPLVSIGQLQHAQLSRYNFEPGFVVGNSYANPRIPLGSIAKTNFTGINGLTITDTSYEVNARLWDNFFFSTLGIDYTAAGGSSFDRAFDFKKLASGEAHLPNPRMAFAPLQGDTSIDRILTDRTDAERAPEAIAARILIKGAFNVNSTSKTAWKAFLSSMGASQLPVLDPESGRATWQSPEGIRFNRFGHVLTNQPFQQGAGGDDDGFWQGWRNLSETELDQLAGEIVKEVKLRGPFRSVGEFVNRNPYSKTVALQRKGALQAALDRTVNAGLSSSVGSAASNPPGADFSEAVDGENQAAGSASYLLQGDVLQSLAPLIQVRSDYFKIRTCGEALDSSGKVVSRAWCEAFVQRVSDFVDSADAAYFGPADLKSSANRTFGRRFRLVSFRWLKSEELGSTRS